MNRVETCVHNECLGLCGNLKKATMYNLRWHSLEGCRAVSCPSLMYKIVHSLACRNILFSLFSPLGTFRGEEHL